MQQRIKKELAPFKSKKISKEEIEQVSLIINTIPNNELIRYQIVNNEVYIQTSNLSDKTALGRSKVITNTLKRITKYAKIENADFIIDMHDNYQNKPYYVKMPPIFVFAANKEINKDKNILFVDDMTLSNNKIGYRSGWYTISKEILEANEAHPWNTKINKMFWRGKLTNSERQNLLNYANKYPQDFNVRLTQGISNSDLFINRYITSLYEAFSMYFSIPPFMSKQDQIIYKMLINLDGYTSTYPGLLWRLLSNSVTIKQETDNEQWFYDAIKPWVHYIPVKQDLSDIIEKVEWVKTHDDEAKKIADESTKFVQNNLMPEHIDLYIVTLLNEYAKLQNFKLEQPTLPKA
jgi:hypothetical protein